MEVKLHVAKQYQVICCTDVQSIAGANIKRRTPWPRELLILQQHCTIDQAVAVPQYTSSIII